METMEINDCQLGAFRLAEELLQQFILGENYCKLERMGASIKIAGHGLYNVQVNGVIKMRHFQSEDRDHIFNLTFCMEKVSTPYKWVFVQGENGVTLYINSQTINFIVKNGKLEPKIYADAEKIRELNIMDLNPGILSVHTGTYSAELDKYAETGKIPKTLASCLEHMIGFMLGSFSTLPTPIPELVKEFQTYLKRGILIRSEQEPNGVRHVVIVHEWPSGSFVPYFQLIPTGAACKPTII